MCVSTITLLHSYSLFRLRQKVCVVESSKKIPAVTTATANSKLCKLTILPYIQSSPFTFRLSNYVFTATLADEADTTKKKPAVNHVQPPRLPNNDNWNQSYAQTNAQKEPSIARYTHLK